MSSAELTHRADRLRSTPPGLPGGAGLREVSCDGRGVVRWMRSRKGRRPVFRVQCDRDPLRCRGRIVLGVGAAALLAIVIRVAIGFVLTRRSGGPDAARLGDPVEGTDAGVPASIADLPLLGPNGQRTDLAAMHGRYVILADFMTSCQEECPITTGALLSVQEALQSAHLTGQVRIVEVSVDAARDTPSRFRAYARRFGVPWELLTAGPAICTASSWSWFGPTTTASPKESPPRSTGRLVDPTRTTSCTPTTPSCLAQRKRTGARRRERQRRWPPLQGLEGVARTRREGVRPPRLRKLVSHRPSR